MAGENYGQGSSREHAALAPMYLGIKAVLCKSFARIHKANLINFGILPLIFEDPDDYDKIQEMDTLELSHLENLYKDRTVVVYDQTSGQKIRCRVECTDADLDLIMAGGALNYIRQNAS